MDMLLDQLQEVSPNANGGYAAGVYANVDRRCRKMSRFWLDLSKEGQYALAMRVEDLKAKRMFVPTIREALDLILSLRERRTDVLERLFPWIVSHYQTAGQGDLAARIEKLELMLMAQKLGVTEPAPRALPVAPVPVEEDEPLVLRKAKSTGESAHNFLSSAFKLVQ